MKGGVTAWLEGVVHTEVLTFELHLPRTSPRSYRIVGGGTSAGLMRPHSSRQSAEGLPFEAYLPRTPSRRQRLTSRGDPPPGSPQDEDGSVELRDTQRWRAGADRRRVVCEQAQSAAMPSACEQAQSVAALSDSTHPALNGWREIIQTDILLIIFFLFFGYSRNLACSGEFFGRTCAFPFRRH